MSSRKIIYGKQNNPSIYGCTDITATNFSAIANIDDGSCVYANAILGCTDPTAQNYNPLATQDNGTCTYPVNPTPNYIDIICSSFTITSDIVYSTTTGLTMDSYKETCNTNTNRPVIFCFHPGGADKTEFSTVKYAKDFAGRGYLAFCIDYGDTGGGSGFTAAKQKQAIINVCCAARYVKANHTAFGINKLNVFGVGISAGALTSVQWNISANNLDSGGSYFSSVINSENNAETSVPTATATQSGAATDKILTFLTSADKKNFFYHGTDDITVSYSQAILTYNDMLAVSIASTFVAYSSEAHNIGGHHDEIILGGHTTLTGSTDTGIVKRFASLIVP